MRMLLRPVRAVGRAIRTGGRAIWAIVCLIRSGESDVRGTYPDHDHRPTGEQAAGQGSVFASMMGVGHP